MRNMKKEELKKEARKEIQKVLKLTSIKAEIQKAIVILVAVSLIAVGGVSGWLNFYSTEDTLEENMKETAEQAVEQIKYRMGAALNKVEAIGSIARLTSQVIGLEDKRSILETYKNKNDWQDIFITDEKGTSLFDSQVNVSDWECFQKALSGETAISDPLYDESMGGVVMMIAAPLWKGGLIDTVTDGAVIAILDGNELSEVVAEIKISKNGSSYIINKEGNTIAHMDYDLVVNASNTVEDAKTDSGLKKLAELETQMAAGNAGFGQYTYGGVSKYMSYAPIELNGWSLAITAPVTDFTGSTILGIFITVVMLIASLIAAVIVARKIGNAIGNPINQCADRLKLLAEGDLESDIPEIESRDETLILAESTGTIVRRMNEIIGDTGYLLAEMAEGNFAVRSKIGEQAYVGAFKQLLLSVRKLNKDLKETLEEIQEASRQVEAGAGQMADSAQGLAEGATEQAGSVEELLATVSEVSGHVLENTKATDQAHDRANVVAREAKVSQEKMHDLTEAMKKIESTSNEISNIIEGIEDIAEQTNLLSLNATIEAARAGEAGRGFAVVADQIGKLAEQSAASAVDTRKLIEASIEEVNSGGVITRDTAGYLDKVMQGLDEILMAVGGVRRASDKQAVAMKEIESGVEQIAQVVENNSAAAEETSATSEELSAQSESLNSLVARFKLT